MPMIHVRTNLLDAAISSDFEKKLCEKVSEVLSKPMEKITLSMHTGLRQMRGGSTDPMVAVDIFSLNVFDEARNPGYTQQFLPFLSQILNLPDKRILLLYHDIKITDIGQVL